MTTPAYRWRTLTMVVTTDLIYECRCKPRTKVRGIILIMVVGFQPRREPNAVEPAIFKRWCCRSLCLSPGQSPRFQPSLVVPVSLQTAGRIRCTFRASERTALHHPARSSHHPSVSARQLCEQPAQPAADCQSFEFCSRSWYGCCDESQFRPTLPAV